MRSSIPFRLALTPAMLAFLATGCGEVTSPPGRTGTLVVEVQTSGGDRDTNYQVAVGNQFKYIFGDSRVAFAVDAGLHTVTIDQIEDNCTLEGPRSVSVEVPRGKAIQAVFTVNCDATGISVVTETEGVAVPNNYQLKVGTLQTPIAVSGNITVTRLTPGKYPVEITLPAPNCNVSDQRLREVTVEHRRVTPVTFHIDCVEPVRLPKIAFHLVSPTPDRSPNEIFLANPDGSGATRIGAGQNASWSPDGKRIAFAATFCDWYYGCNSSLDIIDPETTRRFSHLFGNHRIETPAWAPDGQVIAYTEFVNETLFTVSPAGGLPRHVPIPGTMRVREPSWAPDSKRIALACLVSSGNYDICVINRDGSNLVRLVQRNSIDRQPAWSPDGNTIAFTIAPTSEAMGQIALVPATGGDVTIVTQGSEPSWSRDGTRLLFARSDGLYAINVDGTGLTQLTTGKHGAPLLRP